MPDLTAVRPAEPFADVKARVAAAVEAARDEILDLSHRIHANPEPAFEEHQAAAWVAEVAARATGSRSSTRPAASRRRSGPSAAAAAAATARGSASSPSTTRCPVSATAAATTRWPRRGSARRSRWPPIADELPGEIVFLGTPAEERGSGKQIMIDDGLFEGLDAALLYHPCDREPRREPPARVRGRRRRVHGPAGARGVRSVEGPQRARRDDRCCSRSVGLWRQQLPPDARVHGIIQEGGTAANIIPDRTSAWFMLRSADQAVLRGDEARGSRRCARPPPLATGVDGRGRRSRAARRRCATTASLAERFRREHGRLRHRGPGRRPERRQHRHGQRQLGRARRSTRTSRSATRACPGHSIEFRDAAARPRADETTLLAATLVAQTALELFRDPALVEAAWAEFRAPTAELTASGRPRRATRGCTIGPARPAGRRIRTGGAPSETARPDAARAAWPGAPSPEDHRGRAPPRPRATPTSRRATAGTARTRRSTTSTCPTYVGPPTFMKLPWITDPDELRAAQGRRRDHRRAVRRRRQPPARARGSGRGRSARRSTRRARSTRSSSASSRSRSSTSSTPATPTSSRPGSSAPTR